jgi:hypothetical protein
MGSDWRSRFVVPASLWWLVALLLCLAAPFPAHAEDNDVTEDVLGGQRSPVGAVDFNDLMHAIVVYEIVAANGTTTCGFAETLDGGFTYRKGVISSPGFSAGESPSVVFLDNGRALILCNHFDPATDNTAISVSFLDKGASAPSPPNLLLIGDATRDFFSGALFKSFFLNRVLGGGNIAVFTYFLFTGATGSSLFAKTTVDGGATWSSPSLISNIQGVAFQPSGAVNASGAYASWIESTSGGVKLMGSWGTFGSGNTLTFGSPMAVGPVTLPPSGSYPGFNFEPSNRVAVGLLGNNVVLGYTDLDATGGFSVKAVQSSNWATFGPPMIINDGRPGLTRSAFFADFSLNKTGGLKAVFLDNRLGTVGNLVNVWGSLSMDGITWNPNFRENDLSIDLKGFGTGGFNIGQGISVDATGTRFGQKFWPAGADLNLSHIYTDAPSGVGTPVVSSTLPTARMALPFALTFAAGRAAPLWSTVTVFATIINAGSVTATSVSISPMTVIPAIFTYQTTDPLTNVPTGTPNTPVDIPAGKSQSFVLSFTPTASFPPTDVALSFAGTNTAPVRTLFGINTLVLAAPTVPVPDVVALVGTTTNDGTVHVPGPNGSAPFVLATVNLGAGGPITVSADTGSVNLPLQISVCQTDPMTSLCINPVVPAPSVTVQINNGQTPTFAFFVTATGAIAFDPAVNRIFVSAKDATQVIRGSAGVAVTTSP